MSQPPAKPPGGYFIGGSTLRRGGFDVWRGNRLLYQGISWRRLKRFVERDLGIRRGTP